MDVGVDDGREETNCGRRVRICRRDEDGEEPAAFYGKESDGAGLQRERRRVKGGGRGVGSVSGRGEGGRGKG